MPVLPETEAALAARMAANGILEADLLEKFVRASGPGGQKVNKTSSAVYLKHIPSGIEVKAQESRSQSMNRFLARRILLERIERIRIGKESAEEQRIEKIRRQKRKRSKRSKQRMLADKRHHSAKKDARRNPGD
ncbi:MAG: peptide chain release factor-like protein [Myxococcota bacterium]